MVRPVKKKQIPNLDEAIKETAWKQITELGAPALSLRAIARELKITAPAIYNYFPDRDALVTALIIDAFTSFGDSQLEARDSVDKNDHAGRVRAIGIAYRNWAHAYPQRYHLPRKYFHRLCVRSVLCSVLSKTFARQANSPSTHIQMSTVNIRFNTPCGRHMLASCISQPCS